jgi:hypothetical protein
MYVWILLFNLTCSEKIQFFTEPEKAVEAVNYLINEPYKMSGLMQLVYPPIIPPIKNEILTEDVLLNLKPGDKYWIEKDEEAITKYLYVTTQTQLVDRLIEQINSPYPGRNKIVTM